MRCDSVGTNGTCRLGFISDTYDVRSKGSFNTIGTVCACLSLVLSVGVRANGQTSDFVSPLAFKAGSVLTFTFDCRAREFTVQCDSNERTVGWPQCPQRFYFAVAFGTGWSFTSLS